MKKEEYFLISAPYIHNKGIKSEIQSDIFFYLNESLQQSGHKLHVANFLLSKNKKMVLDIKDIIKKIKNHHTIIIDANFAPGDSSGIYPLELYRFLKKKKNKVICIIPDLLPSLNLFKWLDLSKFLISFSLSGVNWANKKYKTDKFIYYPSIPVPRLSKNNIHDFHQRPYDVGYIGSNKIFRVNFLSSLLKLGKNKISTLIISSFRNSDLIKNTSDYLNLLSKCKFFFCSRASFYEKYSKNILSNEIFDGRYAGRVSEAIAAGCIPLYWQPKKGNFFSTLLREKILYSKYFMFEHSCLGDKKSFAFDEIENDLNNAVQYVNSPRIAVEILKRMDKKNIKTKLRYNNKLYDRYIKPRKFIEFIKKI